MRIARFTVMCNAIYKSSLEIPDEVPKGEELNYIREHLEKCNIEDDLRWVSDYPPETAVTKEDIRNIV